ncbi:MAG: hypothetical protein ACLQVI_18500, partial [Polyangiaceae bacterium]
MHARKVWIGVLGSLVTGVGLVGVFHMPFARGLLMRAGGCPVGNASLAEMEPVQHALIQQDRGKDPAPARPALGFLLDKTTHADAEAWADKAHVSCHDERESLYFCNDVPASALGLPDDDGPVSEVHLSFSTKGVLRDVATMRMHTTPHPAQDLEARLVAAVGAPQEKSGSFDDATLAQHGAASMSSIKYRYSDYIAEILAKRFQAGLVVR